MTRAAPKLPPPSIETGQRINDNPCLFTCKYVARTEDAAALHRAGHERAVLPPRLLVDRPHFGAGARDEIMRRLLVHRLQVLDDTMGDTKDDTSDDTSDNDTMSRELSTAGMLPRRVCIAVAQINPYVHSSQVTTNSVNRRRHFDV